ncbi:Cold shock protein 1 [Apostasia shenzhenica]|uniref:Cold shock protein 1 n=1 Tax=Apostasia shenzhenica TaxID=1088818 RepID=A0A2I0B2V8_9ASPA|nr:Cold shock protein 1 [Apostasia shenzhenica]
MFGHNPKQCVQGQDCFRCNRRGHQAKDCPEKLKTNAQVTILCLRCGDLGHDMASCRNNYAPDDLKGIQCYICQKFGHLCCIDYKDNGSRELSCYNCAQSGHTGQGCAKHHREDHFASHPTLCYRCGQEGHFARGCTKNPKSVWLPGESFTPTRNLKEEKGTRNTRSLPREFGRENKKKKLVFDEKSASATNYKIKGGWVVDDPVSIPKWKRKANGWSSPSKFHSRASGGRFPSPNTPSKRYNFYAESPFSRGSSSRGSTPNFHPRFSTSSFRNPRVFL